MINKYKMQYCQELKDLKIANNKPEKKKPEKKPEEKKEPPKKPSQVKEKLNEIKKMAMDTVNHCKKKENFSANDALKLTNVILKNHKVFETAHKKKINIPKKICQDLKNKPAEGVNALNKLAN